MRNADIDTLEQVADALAKHLPCGEYKLYADFLELCSRLKAKNDKEKQNYQEKADYYRDNVRKWKSANPDKQKQYSKEHRERKKQKKDTAV